jgi:hypothetical protein
VFYLIIIIVGIVAVGGSLLFGAYHVREENSAGERPSMVAARRTMRQSRLVASSDQCTCGGVLQPTGLVSEQFGTLQACDGCRRTWSEDGRTALRSRRIRAPRPSYRRRHTPDL